MKYPNTYHLKLGAKVAKNSNVQRGKLCAMAFSDQGELIAFAHNRKITINLSKRIWTEHAEIALINKLKKIRAFARYKNITVIVIRLNKQGVTMAKPCLSCQKLLEQYPVSVLYSDWGGTIRPL